MNQKEFLLLPALLTRAQAVACGVPADSLRDLAVIVRADDQAVPFGQIGAIQLPGRHCKTKGNAKFKYRKADVGRICGYRTE